MEVVKNPKNSNQVSFKQRKIDLQNEQKKQIEIEQAERKSPFKRFYQVNKDKSEYLISCLQDNPKALEILLFICNHMDKYNAVVCSYKVFQEALNMSQRTIARAVQYLKENGFVYVQKTGTSNVYIVNKELVWNSWGKNTQYCEFPANVILSKTEQEKEKEIKTYEKQITNLEIKNYTRQK